MRQFEEESVFDKCLVHDDLDAQPIVDQKDGYWIQIFVDTIVPGKFLHFVACDNLCAVEHMKYWLDRHYHISISWSTPEYRAKIQARLDTYISRQESNKLLANSVSDS